MDLNTKKSKKVQLYVDECNNTYKHYFSDENGNYKDILPDGYRWESNVRNHINYV